MALGLLYLPYTTSSLGRLSLKRFRVRLFRCFGVSSIVGESPGTVPGVIGDTMAEKEALRLNAIIVSTE